jgi:hypothetical protein
MPAKKHALSWWRFKKQVVECIPILARNRNHHCEKKDSAKLCVMERG